MPDIKRTRRHFWLVLVLLLSVDLIAVGVLISPIGATMRNGQQQFTQQQQKELWKELQTRTLEVLPGRNIEQKIAQTKQQISSFYAERLPGNYSSISERLGKLASANRVQATATKYTTQTADIPGLQRVQIDTTVTGDYTEAVRFINALEREKMFFIIDSISLAEAQGGMVQLNIKVETYLKSA